MGKIFHNFGVTSMVLVSVSAFGTVTMLLWNALLPVFFKLPAIGFWQAIGLLILTRLLFSGIGSNGFYNSRSFASRRFYNRGRTVYPDVRKTFMMNNERFHGSGFDGRGYKAGEDMNKQ
jgi:hypothetical protein